MPAACQGSNGVAHHSAAPINVALATPPIKPSQVRLGLMAGAITWRPSNLPQANCSTSFICTTSTKKNNSRALPPLKSGICRLRIAGV